MREIDRILVMCTAIIMDIAMVFFFVLAYKYWRKRKSPASIFLVLGLTLHMPFSIGMSITSISVILFRAGIIPVTIGPFYLPVLDAMANTGQFLIILGFWIGIRKTHRMKKEVALQYR